MSILTKSIRSRTVTTGRRQSSAEFQGRLIKVRLGDGAVVTVNYLGLSVRELAERAATKIGLRNWSTFGFYVVSRRDRTDVCDGNGWDGYG